jgi:hypothetical protein
VQCGTGSDCNSVAGGMRRVWLRTAFYVAQHNAQGHWQTRGHAMQRSVEALLGAGVLAGGRRRNAEGVLGHHVRAIDCGW